MGARAQSVDRPANIHDVAALSGVAASTVSRALTNPGRISVSTRERIQAAATQLGYIPSRQARALSSGRTGTVAVLVPDISHPGYCAFLKGIYLELKSAGFAQLLLDTEASADVEATVLEQLRKGTDGAIVAHSLLPDCDLLAAASRQPLVAVGRDVPGVTAIIVDPAKAIDEAVDHLLRAGHTKVAYADTVGALGSCAGIDGAAVSRVASARGLETVLLGPFQPTRSSGPAAADAALAAGVSACFASSSMLAFGMLEHFRNVGISVPGDMSLIGCEDSFGAEFCTPALTTFSPPLREAGRTAASMLVRMIMAPPGAFADVESHRVPSALSLRSSTGAVRGSGRPSPMGSAGIMVVLA